MVEPGRDVAGHPGAAGAAHGVLGEAEFAEFYHLHIDKLFAYMRNRAHDRDTARELVDLVSNNSSSGGRSTRIILSRFGRCFNSPGGV